MTAIRVVAPGWASTIQDRGRRGHAHIGVSPSGTVDPALAALVNRLVGNDEDAAVIETCGGLELTSLDDITVATTSEPAPRSVRSGETIRVDPTSDRVWGYAALRGGIAVEAVLGSRSTDTLSGLGPAPLSVGAVLPIGPDPGTQMVADMGPIPPLDHDARVTAGPRADWFAHGWADLLASTRWTVTTANRIGVRLTGVPMPRAIHRELPSEGLVRGAIQAPPDGDLVMMLADHPTTGGYPVIAVVDPGDVALVAQTRPGDTIRLRM